MPLSGRVFAKLHLAAYVLLPAEELFDVSQFCVQIRGHLPSQFIVGTLDARIHIPIISFWIFAPFWLYFAHIRDD
jgi:hypothetical protein